MHLDKMRRTRVPISKKASALVKLLSGISPVAVALSGGLDSSVIAKAASLASGGSVAITVDDFTVPRRDLRDAKLVAKLSGIRHVIVKSKPAEEVLANPKDRCFYCKKHNYGIVFEAASKLGVSIIVDGANADDTLEYRPGMRAARSMGVRSPLLELGLGKQDVRSIAKEFSLPVWNKPSSACLSSRIPQGKRVTRKKLSVVERAEEAIQRMTGIAKVRVRSHEGLARIEVPRENLASFFDTNLMGRVSKKLREIGFSHVALDIEGYRPGGGELKR